MARGGRTGRQRQQRRSGSLVGNAADPAQVSYAGLVEGQRRGEELHDLQAVLATVEGRRLVWRFLAHAGIFNSPFHGDPYHTAHATGRQDMGRWLLAEVNEADSAAFAVMMQEAGEAEAREVERATSIQRNQRTQDRDSTGADTDADDEYLED